MMHRSRAPSIAPGIFFVAQSWADSITDIPVRSAISNEFFGRKCCTRFPAHKRRVIIILGSGVQVPLSLPNFYDFAGLPSIFCDPLRSMVAPRQREQMNSPHKLRQDFGGKARLARDLGSRARQLKRPFAE